MPIVKVTGQGIAAIALSVFFLWAVWISTRIVVRRAALEREEVQQQMERLRRKRAPEPNYAPHPLHHPQSLVTAG